VALCNLPLAGLADSLKVFRGRTVVQVNIADRNGTLARFFWSKSSKDGTLRIEHSLVAEQWPGICLPRWQRIAFLSVLVLYCSLGNLDAGTASGFAICIYTIEYKPFTLLYRMDTATRKSSANSKNNISKYGLTYGSGGIQVPSALLRTRSWKADAPESVRSKYAKVLPVLL